MRALWLLPIALLIAGRAPARPKDEAPSWLRGMVAMETPAFARDANAVVLLADSFRQIGSDGRIVTTTKQVVRILKIDGRSWARADVPYASDYQKIKAFDAWLISPNGDVRAYARKEAVDLAQAMDQVYTEARVLTLSAAASAAAGAIFAYVFTVEERSVFSQDLWSFQTRIPVVASRVTYQVPAGWSVRGTMFAHPPLDPVISAGGFMWELRDQPPVPDEAWGPSSANLTATVALDVRPDERSSSRAGWRLFDTWQDVSRYEAELHDSRAVPDAAITARTKELIAGANSTLDQIKVIGRYVEKINYASIQQALGRGGGHTPNAAAQVFQRHYGDCKDKAVLMRAMLTVAGVRSYSAIAFAQERREIDARWPSPFQFDHCIVAVAVDDTIVEPAVVVHPVLGRLLLYDPTNSLAPPGELLSLQQGCRVLIGAGTQHDLLEVPFVEPRLNRLTRKLEAKLDATGAIVATVTEHAVGSMALTQAREYRGATALQYNGIVQSWISRGARLARVSRVDATDHVTEAGEFDLRVEFVAQNFAQRMGPQLLVFKPTVVPRRIYTALTEKDRRTPVMLSPSLFEETIEITLPADFVVDELPPTVEIHRSFGEFSLAGEMRDGHLEFRRTMLVRGAEIPVERYEEVRSFFEGINRAEQTSVVLKRK